ncbi:MAG TPA: hypothetical protein VH597_06155 [Verrucomicrobiae bacterium]|jgi:tetratricopeptide (TPR) repeat protein|nr:hypothetical protein [Verrucomicrobiae bacterium]
MPDISDYAQLIKSVLIEGGKYFVLLLFLILAIRFWKNARRVSPAKKPKAYVFAVVATVLAGGIGYASFRHSMARLNSYYGMEAFEAGNLDSALALFQTSSRYWRTADALGKEGVCAMLLNHPEEGRQMLDEAKRIRKGSMPPFEEYHEGLYYFVSGKWEAAVPLLESSSRDTQYQWNVTKMLCVITLETNGTAEAAGLMKPFASVAVSEADHAYIVARLDLAEGRTNDARALIDKFNTADCSALLKPRFETLRTRIQN